MVLKFAVLLRKEKGAHSDKSTKPCSKESPQKKRLVNKAELIEVAALNANITRIATNSAYSLTEMAHSCQALDGKFEHEKSNEMTLNISTKPKPTQV